MFTKRSFLLPLDRWSCGEFHPSSTTMFCFNRPAPARGLVHVACHFLPLSRRCSPRGNRPREPARYARRPRGAIGQPFSPLALQGTGRCVSLGLFPYFHVYICLNLYINVSPCNYKSVHVSIYIHYPRKPAGQPRKPFRCKPRIIPCRIIGEKNGKKRVDLTLPPVDYLGLAIDNNSISTWPSKS
jgi:hypothetical protein